ncbi:hypothetical protein WL21_18275 [Burkholderia ubonensis]|uniref:hypothetical protein n=1 Tax=Burkholderia ubonensis TaxID=101571 RepID=UPI0007561440|nr:hypothetical protein [Burkholderia ubonensis]KVO98851.1 hypothetical protein WJ81_30280 [Burkholderia ubonensis]KVZ62881.1 hypothetical protein WL20_14555 [Burkholderia ubonensis]KVZ66735.1 hypothetical protein WL21_18275 [Burkholderia ubonensis]
MNRTTRAVLWWLCLFIAPLVLATIELFHPAGFTHDPGMFDYLSKPEYDHNHAALAYFGPAWWFALHMIQTPCVVLVCIGLWLLVGDDPGPVAWLARLSTFVFLVAYTVLDAVGGIGLGRLLQIAAQMTPDQHTAIATLLNNFWVDRWTGGVGSFISLTGSWAAFFATAFVGLERWLRRRTRAAVVLGIMLAAAGYLLQISHAAMTGPAAFALLAITALAMHFLERRENAKAPQTAADTLAAPPDTRQPELGA